mmetsp:Transcript_5253/g.15209  ORF Transcript_5253/g.15209 Transcript_5253/m.15209 type:complete len:377 (-) Transcript_5253:136-1266(-)
MAKMASSLPAVFSSHGSAAVATAALVFLTVVVGTACGFAAPSSFGRNNRLRAPGSRRGMLDPKAAEGGGGLSPVCDATAADRYRGKNVLITGASGGLGRELARQLARCGASSLILSGRDADRLKNVAEECEFVHSYYQGDESGDGGFKSSEISIKVIPCDLADSDSVKNLGHRALEFCAEQGGRGDGNSGVVDVLVNNGGVSSRSSFLETDASVDELLMRINFLSGSQLAKALVPSMVTNGSGAIVWISSVQGKVGIPNRTSYAASKFAVQGYCEALRGELASSGVTVHVASPGYIRTDLSRSALRGDGQKHGKMDEATANGADPTDVAVTILNSVAQGTTDFVVAATPSARAAIWLRMIAPKFLENKLARRYEKS